MECGFVLFSSSCVPYVASFSGLSIFDCPLLAKIYFLYCDIQPLRKGRLSFVKNKSDNYTSERDLYGVKEII